MWEIPKWATKEEKEKYYRSKCYRSKWEDWKEKTITINKNLVKLYKENDKRLYTEEWQKLYKQRWCDVEPTFWNIKENLWFTRFHLRWMKWVKAELMIQCLTHNIKKLMLFRAS